MLITYFFCMQQSLCYCCVCIMLLSIHVFYCTYSCVMLPVFTDWECATFAYDYCTNEQKVLMSCVLLLVYKQLYFVSTTSTYYCYYCVFQAFLTILFSNISYSPTFQHPNVLHPSSLILHFLSFIYIWLWVWTSMVQVKINPLQQSSLSISQESEMVTCVCILWSPLSPPPFFF